MCEGRHELVSDDLPHMSVIVKKRGRKEGGQSHTSEWRIRKKEYKKKKCQVQTEHFGLSLSFSLLVKAETNLDKENESGKKIKTAYVSFHWLWSNGPCVFVNPATCLTCFHVMSNILSFFLWISQSQPQN